MRVINIRCSTANAKMKINPYTHPMVWVIVPWNNMVWGTCLYTNSVVGTAPPKHPSAWDGVQVLWIISHTFNLRQKGFCVQQIFNEDIEYES